MKLKEKNGEHPLGDAGQLILFGVFMVTWILDSFVMGHSTFLSKYIPLVIRLIILGVTLGTAFYLFRSGHVVVIPDQRPTEIVSSGAFRYVRHPLYLGSILVYLGLSVSTASLFCLGLLVVAILFYNYIAGYEEKLLEIKLGQDYITYKENTGKWMPRLDTRRQLSKKTLK
ncbi:MAG: isoprenylcysteine carboxylmethyltransferase family protein [Desulfobacterales bacterium]|jgi:protein-S-isoprenylcysteine O-methyltransferase Ste14